MGLLHLFLGIEIHKDGGVFISQKNYAEKILKMFGMFGCVIGEDVMI